MNKIDIRKYEYQFYLKKVFASINYLFTFELSIELVVIKLAKMSKPRTLKAAKDNGYYISKINYAGSNRCRVDLKPIQYKPGMQSILSFWVNTAYVKRTYTEVFNAIANY